MAAWEFIGDAHIRFVFDGPQTMRNATPQDLDELGIRSVDEALALELSNIKRVYGEPSASPWEGGVFPVQGKSPDLDSSYLLDRRFWQSMLAKYPEGVVVSVPKLGGLLFTPSSDVNRKDQPQNDQGTENRAERYGAWKARFTTADLTNSSSAALGRIMSKRYLDSE